MTAKSTHIRSCYRILYPDGCTFAVLGSFGYSSQLVQSPINGKNAKSSSLSSPPFLGSMWYTSWTFSLQHDIVESSSSFFFRVLLMFQLSSALFAPNLSTTTSTFFLRSSRFVCRLWIESDIYSQKKRRKRVRVNSILSAAYRIDDIPPLLWCWYSIETWYETRSQQGSAQVDKLKKSIKRNFKLVFGSTSTQTSASKKSIFSHHRSSDRQVGGSLRREFTILYNCTNAASKVNEQAGQWRRRMMLQRAEIVLGKNIKWFMMSSSSSSFSPRSSLGFSACCVCSPFKAIRSALNFTGFSSLNSLTEGHCVKKLCV